MEHIIKPLDSKLLGSWGFEFDGYYWLKQHVPFKLTASNKPNTYMVVLENASPGQTPPPIETNSQLLQMLCQTIGLYIHHKLKDQNFISPKLHGMAVAKAASEFFQFDQNLKFRLSPAPGGLGLSPDNEYTETIMGGLEVEFIVEWSDGTEEYMYYSPTAISFNFLKSLKNSEVEPKMVWVTEVDGSRTPFFGCGMPKIIEESSN